LRRRPGPPPDAAGVKARAGGVGAPDESLNRESLNLESLNRDVLAEVLTDDLCASEGGAAAAAESVPSVRTSLGALLAGHILRDGEVVLLILKPSMWYIVFSSLRFLAAGLIAVIGAKLWVHNSHAVSSILYTATFVVAGRVMWAVLQWQGRLYVLTDMRVVRLSGVFSVEILDCALRKVAQTRLTRTFREKLWRLGSIEIIPVDDSCPPSVWQTVKKPAVVQAKIQATIDRAKQGGFSNGAE
jgi:hypothetical protein